MVLGILGLGRRETCSFFFFSRVFYELMSYDLDLADMDMRDLINILSLLEILFYFHPLQK
jgi:hypothetical protein